MAETGFDPLDPESLGNAADWLRKLTNNRTFLADLLIDRLSGRSQGEVESGYGPQALAISPVRGEFFLRANIWPAEHDLCFRNSGANTFVYGLPHDHNFSFLTSGYCGPGYRSDYFEYEYEDVAGYPGEAAALKFLERGTLSEGKVMLYRAHKDVHSQLPPKDLSVSLNIMHVDPAQCWFDQYGFDLEQREVSRFLSPNATEAFVRIAVATGSPDAADYAKWAGHRHPSDRLRMASFEARAATRLNTEQREQLWREAAGSGNLMVGKVAEQRLAAL